MLHFMMVFKVLTIESLARFREIFEACSSKDGGASIGKMRDLVQLGRAGVSLGEFELFFSKLPSHQGAETLTPSVFS